MTGAGPPGLVAAAAAVPPRRPAAASYWRITWRQLRRNPAGMVGLGFAALLVAIALLAPLLANDKPIVARFDGGTYFPAFTGYVDTWVPWQRLRNDLKSLRVGGDPPWFPFSDHEPALGGRTWKQVAAEPELTWALWPPVRWNPNQFDEGKLLQPPDRAAGHPLGTDDLGRDVLARMLHGTVVALTVGVVATGLAVLIGAVLGLLAGYLGGWVDLILSRFTEIVITFPTFFLIIAVISFLEPSIVNVMLVLGLVGWTGIFRLLRGEVLRCRAEDYVLAAEAAGVPRWRIMAVHVLPNAVPPVFVAVAFGIAAAVLAETTLSFLGFGDPAAPSWGEVVSQGRHYVGRGLWHLTLWPGLAIFLTLTAFNLLGQGLRDAMDPRLRR